MKLELLQRTHMHTAFPLSKQIMENSISDIRVLPSGTTWTWGMGGGGGGGDVRVSN